MADDAKWRRVEDIIRAGVNVYTLQNDIAMVRIEGAGQQVIPRAIRTPSNNAECLIYGYGSVSFTTNTITSNIIRFARVDLITHQRCEAILGRVTAPTEGMGQFCALGRNGADACNGE